MKPGTKVTPKHLIGFGVAMLCLVGIALAVLLQSRPVEVQTVPISRILNLAERGQLASATIEGNVVTTTGTDGTSLQATKEDGAPIVDVLRRAGVEVTVSMPHAPIWPVPLLVIFPAVLVLALIAASRKGPVQGEASRFTRMSRVHAPEHRPNITFADVAGIEEAKQELREVVEFLKHPERFRALGARVPRGVLLVGPPGTGKTLLAKAVAGEAEVPFFSLSGSQFVEMFVGVGAARVRDLFNQAKKHAPGIIFIDELDAVGRQRGASASGANEEREHTLNQLLVEMDGFGTNTSVIVLAATNRPDVLDSALLRPGRFDRQVTVDAPDIKGRRAILTVHAQDKPLAEGVDLDNLARRTAGLAGAELANLLNEAAILAARSGRESIGRGDLDEALLRVMAGPERKSRVITDHEKRVVAYHEAGHALVMKSLPHADPVRMVTIIARGRALGITVQQPSEDRYLITREQLLARMAGAMGGRAAEELIFGTVTTGAGQDIEYTTGIARRMVCEFGMSELGATSLGARSSYDPGSGVSEAVAARVDAAVMGLVDEAYATARRVLTERHDDLVRLSERLIEVESMDEQELDALFDEPTIGVGEPAPDLREPALVA